MNRESGGAGTRARIRCSNTQLSPSQAFLRRRNRWFFAAEEEEEEEEVIQLLLIGVRKL